MNRLFVAALATGFLATACGGDGKPGFDTAVDMRVDAGGSVVGPRLETGADGVIRLSWMERGAEGATLRFASLDGEHWSPPRDVVTDAGMFVNWADLPSVNALPDGTLVAHWLRYSADEIYAYDIVVAHSYDNGLSWSEPVSPHDDGTPTEHGFVSMYATGGSAALLWLDGRNTGEPLSENALDTSMTLRAATFSADGVLANEQLIDASVCDCCQTDIAVSEAGPIAVYRNRTADEIRDIYVTRFADGRWQAGTPLFEDQWQISACPVNGPAIAANGAFVAVAWFTAAGQNPLVKLSLSQDGGRTFAAPLIIGAGSEMGRVGLGLLPGNLVAVSRVENGPDDHDLVSIALVLENGEPGPVVTIGTSGLVRMFPQLASIGDDLIIAWTDAAGDDTRLVVKRIPVRLAP